MREDGSRVGVSVYPSGVTVRRAAAISGPYRWSLWREWGMNPARPSLPVATFVMLNPSRADAEADDATIRRCVGFARALGCEALCVVNLYAYRATDPAALWTAPVDPTGGEHNDDVLRETAAGAAARQDPLIAAWGNHARPDRVAHVLALPGFDRLSALGVTKSGAPRHPVRLPASTRPIPYARNH